MKLLNGAVAFSFLMTFAGVSEAASFPLNGVYSLTDNTCLPAFAEHQQIFILSSKAGLSLRVLEGCLSTSQACDPSKVSYQTWGDFAAGISTNIGAEGLVVNTGTFARDGNEFVSFENESNDTAGGAPSYGTNLVVNKIESSGVVQINYRDQYCVLKAL